MNRLSLVRYTSAVALGLSTLWSAAVCAAEDAGAFDKIQQIRAGDLNIGYVDIGPRDGQPVILLEVMKMENELLAPAGGVVEKIHIEKNHSVGAGDVLLTIR